MFFLKLFCPFTDFFETEKPQNSPPALTIHCRRCRGEEAKQAAAVQRRRLTSVCNVPPTPTPSGEARCRAVPRPPLRVPSCTLGFLATRSPPPPRCTHTTTLGRSPTGPHLSSATPASANRPGRHRHAHARLCCFPALDLRPRGACRGGGGASRRRVPATPPLFSSRIEARVG